ADLYFRLAQYTVSIPPLRERLEDLGYLAQRFTVEAGVELRRPVQQVSPQAIEILRAQPWPGNVRELRNVIRQAVRQTDGVIVRGDTVRAVLRSPTVAAAAAPVASPGTPGESLREIASRAATAAERGAIIDTLRATGGNKSQTARILKTDYKTLHVKMKQLGL